MFASTIARVKSVTLISAIGLIAPFVTSLEAKAIDLTYDTGLNYTTVGDPSDYIVNPGQGYDGVVDLILEGSRCTGALLPTGAHILTAAHCVTDDVGNQDVFSGTATFELLTGDTSLSIENFFIHENWTSSLFNGNDIAVLELEDIAPEAAERYDLYREVDEVGQIGDKVGYGWSGNGNIGSIISSGTKRRGQNLYDSTGALFGGTTGLLAYDFDNGQAENDGFGFFFGDNYADLGLGLDEVNAAPGDSGGPTFINGQIAGVTSFGMRYVLPNGANSDIDNVLNSSFGEFGFDTRVSSYTGWIDEILNAWLDANDEDDNPGDDLASVPEPSALAGLMVLGAAGKLLKRKML